MNMKEPFSEAQEVADLHGTETSSNTVWETGTMMHKYDHRGQIGKVLPASD